MEIIEINNLLIENNTNLVSISFNEKENKVIISQIMNPEIIDLNFNELENRINNLESEIRLRYRGELMALKSKVEKLENVN